METKQPKVILFGSSLGGRRAYDYLKDRRQILAYCDNSLKRQGKTLRGRPILSPQAAVDLQPDEFWISSMYFYEITAQLLRMGVDKKKIFIVDPSVLDGMRAGGKPALAATEAIIWGVSLAAQRAFNYYHANYHIRGFVTTQPAPRGYTFCQQPLFCPQDLAKMEWDALWVPAQAEAEARRMLEPSGAPLWRLDVLPAQVTDTEVEPLWQLRRWPFRRRVAIWGLGPLSQETLRRVKKTENFVCFVNEDIDAAGAAGKLLGRPVVSLRDFLSLGCDKVYLTDDSEQALKLLWGVSPVHPLDIEIVDGAILRQE